MTHTPDPTGLRRLKTAQDDMLSLFALCDRKAVEIFLGTQGMPVFDALFTALAAVRVADLERVVALVKDADLRHDQDCPCIFDLEICTCHVKPIRQALAALEKETPHG